MVVPFDEIMPGVLDGKYRSGLIIHEGQLTYKDHDLNVIIDLGVWWNERTGGWPMPLGGNVVRRDLGQDVMEDITRYTKMSIEHAIRSPEAALEFAKAWGRGIDDDTNEAFVGMYVNDRTIDYKQEGRFIDASFARALMPAWSTPRSTLTLCPSLALRRSEREQGNSRSQ